MSVGSISKVIALRDGSYDKTVDDAVNASIKEREDAGCTINSVSLIPLQSANALLLNIIYTAAGA